MQHQELARHLSLDLEEVIFSITLLDIIRAIERRIGKEEISTLTPDDLNLAKEEVLAAIDHNLDIRDYIDMGIDAWEITRNL